MSDEKSNKEAEIAAQLHNTNLTEIAMLAGMDPEEVPPGMGNPGVQQLHDEQAEPPRRLSLEEAMATFGKAIPPEFAATEGDILVETVRHGAERDGREYTDYVFTKLPPDAPATQQKPRRGA